MKTKKNVPTNNLPYFIIGVVFIIGIVIYWPKNTPNNVPINQSSVVDQKNCLSEDCLMVNDLSFPVGELPSSVKDALNQALLDEYKAFSTYQAVISKLGSQRPFSMIIRAEEQHISSLKSIYDKYGLTIPQNTFKATSPATLSLACQTGVAAEVANATLYRDKLIPAVTDYPEITRVFENLMNASEQKHLPAFSRCQ